MIDIFNQDDRTWLEMSERRYTGNRDCMMVDDLDIAWDDV